MSRHAPPITLTDDARRRLTELASRPGERLQSTRASILLMAAEGRTNEDIARVISLDPSVVGRWRKHFLQHGWSALEANGHHPVDENDPHHLGVESIGVSSHDSSGRVLSVPPLVVAGTIADLLQDVESAPHPQRWEINGVHLSPPNRALILSSADAQTSRVADTLVQLPADADAWGGISVHQPRAVDAAGGVADALTFLSSLSRIDKLISNQTDPLYRHREWLAFLDNAIGQRHSSLTYYIIADRHLKQTQKHWRVREWFQGHENVRLFYAEGGDWLHALEELIFALSNGHALAGSFEGALDAARAVSSYYLCLKRYQQTPGPFEWWDPTTCGG